MLRRVFWDLVRIRRRDSRNDGHDGNTWRQVFKHRTAEATHAQDADALTALRTTRRRGRLLLVGAAVRAADAIDRVQRSEYREHHDGCEPAHLPDYKGP